MAEAEHDAIFYFGPNWPDDELALELILATQVGADRNDRAMVLRVATVTSSDHARALAERTREATIHNFRFASPSQARRLASTLVTIADSLERKTTKLSG